MTYAGFDVIPVTHNLRDALTESFARSGTLLDPGTGARWFDDQAGIPLPVRSLLWSCFSRSDVAALRGFLDARLGRVVPFWAPTCARDLRLAADASPSTTLTIQRAGYGDFVFGMGAPRQYLALFPGPDPATMLLRKAVDCTPMDAATEMITLDATTGVALSADATVISFLTLCRLTEDFVDIDWENPSSCEASLSFTELPAEVPA